MNDAVLSLQLRVWNFIDEVLNAVDAILNWCVLKQLPNVHICPIGVEKRVKNRASNTCTA